MTVYVAFVDNGVGFGLEGHWERVVCVATDRALADYALQMRGFTEADSQGNRWNNSACGWVEAHELVGGRDA